MKKELPKVIVLCGIPGSGKTTYAKELEKEGFVRFSLDERMHERYGTMHDCELAVRELATKHDLLFEWVDLLHNGRSVVLDYGFFKEAERRRYVRLAEALGFSAEIHYLKTDLKIALSRAIKRNAGKDNIHYFDEDIFNAMVAQFEEPPAGPNVKTVQNDSET